MVVRYKKLKVDRYVHRRAAHIVKMTVVGGSGMGKSNLIGNLENGGFNDRYNSDISRIITEININDEIVRLDVWESRGDFPSSGYFYPQVALVVIDVTDKNSLVCANEWIDKLKKYDPKILLVATKIDETQKRVISSKELKNYAQAKQFPCIETSVKENRNVTEAFAVGASLHINKEDLTTKQKPSLATRTISAEFKLMDRLVFSYYANICETSFYSSHEDRENTIENLIKKMGAFKADYLSKDAQLNSEDYQKIADWVKEAIRETKISHFTHSWWARKGVTHSRLATALERYLKEIQPFLIADKEDVKPEEPKKIESATNNYLTLASRYGS